ncbi:MAG: metallophosphoesterase [Magnetococcales bacterium]|nr:metallophosphoesterase [Magnetococcales bacterium]
MAPHTPEEEDGLLRKLAKLFRKNHRVECLDLKEEILLRGGEEIQIRHHGQPIQLTLGKKGQELLIVPSGALDHEACSASAASSSCFLVVDPERLSDELSGFLRLEDGGTLLLGRGDAVQQGLMHYSSAVGRRHLTLVNDRDVLVLKDLGEDGGTEVGPLRKVKELTRRKQVRLERLKRLRDLFGGPLEPLEPVRALETIREVNALLREEPHRPRNALGEPGGVVLLPHQPTPVIVGDLHAQVDNLLKLFTELPLLEGLERRDLRLVILGDAVHSEMDGQMARMDSSLLMMDLIFRLKLRFPGQVFYVRGNHDGFFPEVQKGGVLQGILWAREVVTRRGTHYYAEMEKFYDRLPYVVLSREFVACHAAPPIARVTLPLLINIHQYPGLARELTWNRLRRPNHPAGYTASDVKRLRSALDLNPETPFLVSHNPLSRDRSIWFNAGGIPEHHIVFSGLPHCIGLFTRIRGRLLPLTLPTEPLLALANRLE